MSRYAVPAVALAVFLLFAAGFVWLAAPWFQEPLYFFLVQSLPFWIILLVGAVTAGVIAFVSRDGLVPTFAAVFFVGVAFLYMIMSGYVVDKRMYDAASKEKVAELPDTTFVRYHPWEVASKIGTDRSTDPRAELGEFEPVQTENGISWVAPREPTSIAARRLYGGAPGVLQVNPDNTIDVNKKTFKYGEGLSLNRHWEYQAHKANYWTQKTNPYYVMDGEEALLVSPLIKHKFDWSGLLPVTIPEWDGMIVIHPSGKIEDISVEEAQADERFEGERLYPKELSRRVMDSFRYSRGYKNTIIGPHADEPAIDDVSAENPFPYILPTVEGPQWVAGAEPRGRTDALFMMFFTDARNGHVRYTRYGDEDAMIGPQKALARLSTIFPNYRWGSTVEALEPRPVVRRGTLYWMISLTNDSYSAVTQTVFIEAGGKNESFTTNSLEDTEAFLKGDDRVANSVGGAVNSDGTGGSDPAAGGNTDDPVNLTDEQIDALLREIAEEMKQRN